MKWIVTTGSGLKLHSAHKSLDDALRCIHARILRGRPDFDSVKFEANTGDDNGNSDGTLTCLDWNTPSRKMTDAEIDQKVASKEIDKRIAKFWKDYEVKITDWERVAKIVTFVGEPVESVSVCREDRHRQYLQRAGRCNDVAERVREFEALLASV